ncbi:MAG: hypothetical protein V1900_01175, partial [Candidatus Aenigmatarchaeota archaeon]
NITMVAINTTAYRNGSVISISDGLDSFIVYCNDTTNNLGSASRYFTVDTTAPSFTAISNQTLEYGTVLGYDIDATDASGVSCFSVNDTTNFQINCSGYLMNNTRLDVNIYWLNITVNDTLDNRNSTLMWVNVTDTTAPNVTLNSPADGYFNDTASAVNVTFNCSATDNYALANISLYITNSQNASFALNQTSVIAGTNNSANWTLNLGNGNYTWNCLAYDTYGNSDWSENRTIIINFTDSDNDGVTDSQDNLEGNTSSVSATGVSDLNVTVGGNSTSGSYNEIKEVAFYESSVKIINFTHNFSSSELDMGKITVIKSTNSIIVNLSGQLQSNYNKTIYIDDNSFVALCVKDAEISAISEISSGCNGANETDFSSCLSASATINGITCADEGTRIRVSNLRYSAIKGTPATPAPAPSGGGGGGLAYSCKNDSDCDDNEACIKSACKSVACKADKDCKNGYCLNYTCYKYGCVVDADCNENQYCSNHACKDYECMKNSDCNVEKGEVCRNHKCTKLFDVLIQDFNSSAKVGEFFEFTYFIKGMADINDDVDVRFWLEKNQTEVTSGKDTIYVSSFEEKTKTAKLFLPSTMGSGVYTFFIEVAYKDYRANSYRTVEISVDEEGNVIIAERPSPIDDIYFIGGWIGLAIIIILLVLWKRLIIMEKTEGFYLRMSFYIKKLFRKIMSLIRRLLYLIIHCIQRACYYIKELYYQIVYHIRRLHNRVTT